EIRNPHHPSQFEISGFGFFRFRVSSFGFTLGLGFIRPLCRSVMLLLSNGDMTVAATASILVVEDDPNQFRLYAKVLKGYRLTCVVNGTAALKALEERLPDLIILDHVLSDGERGSEFLPRLKAMAAHVPVVIVSGTLDIQGKLNALQGPDSAHYLLEKPVRAAALTAVVEKALNQCGLGETVHALAPREPPE